MSVTIGNPLLLPTEGYEINRSVRLRSSASAYLNRTPGSAGNRQTLTLSDWVKRGALGSQQDIFIAGSNANGQLSAQCSFDSSDKISLYGTISGSAADYVLVTTQVFRDPSAWYHIVLVFDTTNATAANRVRLYVNGVQVTSFSSTTYPSQNYNTAYNNTVSHTIGRFTSVSANPFDGYMTEINFIDGQALTPSSFGETDAATGVWKPKKYVGTYGTNGFYLNFSDNSAATAAAIGKDYSGNGNNWTPNNISVTAGVTYDSMVDSPTVGATSSNYCVLNPLYTNGFNPLTITNGNLTATSSSGARIILSTIYQNTGIYYFEATCTTVGTLTGSRVGIRNDSVQRFYDNSGNYFDGSSSAAYGATYTTGDVIGVAFDLTNQTITFYKNGTSQGQKTAIGLTGQDVTPFVYADTSGVWNINFGQRPFSYTPPTGFKALNTQNLPEQTIKKGNAYFDATLYTGTGSAQSIVNSGAMQPDFVWTKSRSASNDHILMDSVRGLSVALFSNLTNAEVTDSTRITSLNANGFTLGTSASTNQNAVTFVGWQWNAGGSTVTNTSGSISAQVRANATAGFSVVTYTGTQTASTVGHGLGVAPKMIIVKARSNGTYNWTTWHGTFTGNGYIYIDSNTTVGSSSGPWNGTLPTSSVFSLGADLGTNKSGDTYVAYVFTAVAGYSAFGSYTGNGSADGPFVFTGFRPRWVMIKRTDSTSAWLVIDTTRQTYNVQGPYLTPNTSDAETTGTTVLDVVSNGFKSRSSSTLNTSSGSYIYAAFAENPFKYSLAR